MPKLEKIGNQPELDQEFYRKVYDKGKDNFNKELRMQRSLRLIDFLIAEGRVEHSSTVSRLLEVLNTEKKYYIEGRDVAKDAVIGGKKKSEFSVFAEMEAQKAQQALDDIKDTVLLLDNMKESGMIPEQDTVERLTGSLIKILQETEARMNKEEKDSYPDNMEQRMKNEEWRNLPQIAEERMLQEEESFWQQARDRDEIRMSEEEKRKRK